MMQILVTAIAVVVVVVACAVLFGMRSAARRPVVRPGVAAPAPHPPVAREVAPGAAGAHSPWASSTASATVLPSSQEEVPAALVGAFLRDADELDPASRERLLRLIEALPRPSPALRQILSPGFAEGANAEQLAELLQAEPWLAARILSTANSAFHGLDRSIASIGRAITFLGFAAVRRLALQYLLHRSMQVSDPPRAALFHFRWRASLIGSELCFQLAQRLNLPDHGALATQVVLSFVGHFAVVTLCDARALHEAERHDMLSRSIAEQEALGLCAAGIGTLLLRQWALPEDLVLQVRAIDATLLRPADPQPGASLSPAARAALAFLCARVGEFLALHGIDSLKDWRLADQSGPDFFHAKQHLAHPALARLPELLASPDVRLALQQTAVGSARA